MRVADRQSMKLVTVKYRQISLKIPKAEESWINYTIPQYILPNHLIASLPYRKS